MCGLGANSSGMKAHNYTDEFGDLSDLQKRTNVMAKPFRELMEPMSSERRESIEVRQQAILTSIAFERCTVRDTLADLSEQEIDRVIIAQANNDVAWEEPILVHKTKLTSSTI